MAADKKREDCAEVIEELESLIQDKISELHNVKGAQTERHAYIYYRALVWKLKTTLGLRG